MSHLRKEARCKHARHQLGRSSYHYGVEGFGHHCNEHIQQENFSGYVIGTKQELPEHFNVVNVHLQGGKRNQAKHGPEKRGK